MQPLAPQGQFARKQDYRRQGQLLGQVVVAVAVAAAVEAGLVVEAVLAVYNLHNPFLTIQNRCTSTGY